MLKIRNTYDKNLRLLNKYGLKPRYTCNKNTVEVEKIIKPIYNFKADEDIPYW